MADSNLFIEPNSTNGTDPGFTFTGDTILAQSSPVISQTNQVLATKTDNGRDRIISYKVESGDSLESIADKFEISRDTIRWANSLSGDRVSSGDELLILPTTGILYYVQRGESLSDIAAKHKADMGEIVAFNDSLDNISDTIRPGDSLIIPNGQKPPEPVRRAPQINISSGFAAVTRGTVTQGSHPGHANAVDIANNCGTPIYAGQAGTVTRSGWDSRAGNYIWVDHGSVKALYAHLQGINVSSGQRVSSGQQIGTMGNTGYTIGATGCHLHFETRGSNPFSHLRRGDTM